VPDTSAQSEGMPHRDLRFAPPPRAALRRTARYGLVRPPVAIGSDRALENSSTTPVQAMTTRGSTPSSSESALVIEHREALIYMISEAAELENALSRSPTKAARSSLPARATVRRLDTERLAVLGGPDSRRAAQLRTELQTLLREARSGPE
jgi:hypothetical protein